MNVEIITVATHNEGTLQKIIHNKFKQPVKVLGLGQKWTGFKMKNQLIYDYIKNQPDNKIIIYLDGFDSLINGTASQAVSTFINNNYKVLFSKDELKFDLSPIFSTSRLFPPCNDNTTINAGLWMGYVKYIKILLEDSLKEKCKDDQRSINIQCKKFDFISIDKEYKIFQNFNSMKEFKEKKHNTIFISFPGTFTFKRSTRAIFEYGQFYIPHIIIFFTILIFILYYFNQNITIIFFTIILILYFIFMDKSCI